MARQGKVYAPAWWLEAQESRDLSAAGFKQWRTLCAFITQVHAAQFFRVPVTTIHAWETGREFIPYAVAYVIRHMPEDDAVRLSRPGFQEWAIYYDPDTGAPKLHHRESQTEFTPAQLTFYAQALAHFGSVERDRDKLRTEIDTLRAENDELRRMFKVAEVTDELHAMRDRLGALLARVNIADVLSLDAHKARRAA